jgi:hypothetical protein
MGTSFEWYMKTFHSELAHEELSDEDYEFYRNEFEIWQESSGHDKRKMWPRSPESMKQEQMCI